MVRFAVVCSETAIVLNVGRTDDESLSATAGNDDIVAPAPDGVREFTHRYDWDAQQFIAVPPRPGPWARWSGSEWVDPRSEEEIQSERSHAIDADWFALRAERDRRLLACDWTDLPNAPLSEAQRAAWLAYRQALRDMPETTEDPAAPVWPTAPAT